MPGNDCPGGRDQSDGAGADGRETDELKTSEEPSTIEASALAEDDDANASSHEWNLSVSVSLNRAPIVWPDLVWRQPERGGAGVRRGRAGDVGRTNESARVTLSCTSPRSPRWTLERFDSSSKKSTPPLQRTPLPGPPRVLGPHTAIHVLVRCFASA